MPRHPLRFIVTSPIKIDIWSDIACPWCYIGKRHLEGGLAALGDDAPEVEIEYHSFELAPDTPVDFEGSEVDFLAGHKGIPMEQLAAAQKAAIDTGKAMTAQGKSVRYIRSTFVPGEGKCMCLFEAPSPQSVKELNDTAKLPYSRIVEALDLTP